MDGREGERAKRKRKSTGAMKKERKRWDGMGKQCFLQLVGSMCILTEVMGSMYFVIFSHQRERERR